MGRPVCRFHFPLAPAPPRSPLLCLADSRPTPQTAVLRCGSPPLSQAPAADRRPPASPAGSHPVLLVRHTHHFPRCDSCRLRSFAFTPPRAVSRLRTAPRPAVFRSPNLPALRPPSSAWVRPRDAAAAAVPLFTAHLRVPASFRRPITRVVVRTCLGAC